MSGKGARGERLVEIYGHRKSMGKPTSREMNRSWKSHMRWINNLIERHFSKKMGGK